MSKEMIEEYGELCEALRQKFLAGLNREQRRAVISTEGPQLILAGAGSGKTRVLVHKIAYMLMFGADCYEKDPYLSAERLTKLRRLVESPGASWEQCVGLIGQEAPIRPWQILAITFTNKAAAEMKDRVAALIGETAKDIWLSTFHSFCAKFLRFEIDHLPGYSKNFTIYDTSDSQSVIKHCLKTLNLDEKQYAPMGVLSAISNAKNALMGPREFARQADHFYAQKVAEIYELYQERLWRSNALDFDDLLMLTVTLLEENEEVQEKYQEKFRYILIDEYQDTNHAQYRLAKILAAKRKNLCVVGDADQSIYGWRGADISNIRDFERDYRDAQVIKLEQNYRSVKTILDAANAVIENNGNRIPKTLLSTREQGDKITYYLAQDEHDEARFISDQISQLNTIYNMPYGDMAVLYRTNAQSRVVEEWFMRQGIPYTMVGGLKFYDRKEIKDIIAYLKVIHNPADTVSLQRIINVPKRGIGAASIEKMEAVAALEEFTFFDVLSNTDKVPKLTAKVKKGCEDLATLIFSLMGQMQSLSVRDLIEKVIHESGYLLELQQEGTDQAESRIENMKELLSVARDFAKDNNVEDTLENFLERVALVSDIDTADLDGERVTLMTLHSAKGLEFRTAFLAGLEEGIFPHSRALMDDSQMEEERRLCYVGITRAKERLYLTGAKMRTIYGRAQMSGPSRFIYEIPSELLEQEEPRRPQRPVYNGRSDSQQRIVNSPFRSAPTAPVGQTFAQMQQSQRQSLGQQDSSRLPNSSAMQGSVRQASTSPGAARISSAAAAGDWKAGDKALHKKYGVGTVVSVKGSGEEQELTIAFPGVGIKPFMVKYAPLQRVE
ncbi:MAG: DNA helicase PcrA [Sporomusaceae bacterium]|nr:DNA helicase PcrA [Sporomusaceae bacterium]